MCVCVPEKSERMGGVKYEWGLGEKDFWAKKGCTSMNVCVGCVRFLQVMRTRDVDPRVKELYHELMLPQVSSP